jgi:hypothetical protein
LKLPKRSTTSEDRKPKSLKESIYDMTPIVLTVIATVLAGLSSSEMTKAQYYRAYAAQMQSKASDQWAYYQAKRMRTVEADNSLDLLEASSRPGRFDPDRLIQASQSFQQAIGLGPSKQSGNFATNADRDLRASLENSAVLAALNGSLPAVNDDAVGNDNIQSAMNGVASCQGARRIDPPASAEI